MFTAVIAGLLALAAAIAHAPLLASPGRRWQRLVLVGCNDDFVSRASNLLELLAHDPDVIFIQEGKAADYRQLRDADGLRLLPRHQWGVHQDTSSPDRAGSVVIWRFDRVDRTAAGFTFAVRARGLLTRWISWLRATVGGRRLFLFSAHRPPVRARRFWHPFDVVLWARLAHARATGRIVLGEIDGNEHGGPKIPPGFSWHAVGDSIDGFILSASKDLEVLEHPVELRKGSSDHHPIRMVVRIRTRRRRTPAPAAA